MAIMERIDGLSTRQRLLIMIIIILFLGAGFYYRVHKPKQREIQGWESQLSTLQTDLQGLRAIAAKLPEFKEETRKLQLQLDEIKKQLPKEKEIPVLLENVSKAGTESGLEFDLFRPKPEVDKGFYMEVPVDIVVKGPFHNLATFLDKIAHFPRIMNITASAWARPRRRRATSS